MWKCKHCQKSFDFDRVCDKANHSRHCDMNPDRKKSYQRGAEKRREIVSKKLGVVKDFSVVCSTCGDDFVVREREYQFPKKEMYFCSRSCASSVGGLAKSSKLLAAGELHYRAIAKKYHEKRCVVCGEDKIVAVHHLNEDHDDNDPKNLIWLCPTHHQYVHSKCRDTIQSMIDEYLDARWNGP